MRQIFVKEKLKLWENVFEAKERSVECYKILHLVSVH